MRVTILQELWECLAPPNSQMGVASGAEQRQHFTLIGRVKTKLSHTVAALRRVGSGRVGAGCRLGLLTCGIKRASSAACTLEQGQGLRADPIPDFVPI